MKTPSKWSSIRVSVDQLSVFAEYRDELERLVKLKPGRYPHWLNVPNLSIAAALEYLLCKHVDHVDRGRTANRKRKAKLAVETSDR